VLRFRVQGPHSLDPEPLGPRPALPRLGRTRHLGGIKVFPAPCCCHRLAGRPPPAREHVCHALGWFPVLPDGAPVDRPAGPGTRVPPHPESPRSAELAHKMSARALATIKPETPACSELRPPNEPSLNRRRDKLSALRHGGRQKVPARRRGVRAWLNSSRGTSRILTVSEDRCSDCVTAWPVRFTWCFTRD
jgi:hypothetical protein